VVWAPSLTFSDCFPQVNIFSSQWTITHYSFYLLECRLGPQDWCCWILLPWSCIQLCSPWTTCEMARSWWQAHIYWFWQPCKISWPCFILPTIFYLTRSDQWYRLNYCIKVFWIFWQFHFWLALLYVVSHQPDKMGKLS
jgi:hypothetical protein